MKLITEYVEQNIETICEQKKDGSKDYYIEGVFMQSFLYFVLRIL
jgi:hypothetical protein